MSNETALPPYVRRPEEALIDRELAAVQADGKSRVLLLYGAGGVGKTYLLRNLADRSTSLDVRWLPPLDLDDPEYWLVSNVEREIVRYLDRDLAYFKPYVEYVNQLGQYTRSESSQQAARSHLRRIKREFADSYKRYVVETGSTIVVSLDTVEAVRGLYSTTSLTQWIKALPNTLFILAGRPWRSTEPSDELLTELSDHHHSLPTQVIPISAFSLSDGLSFLAQSGVGAAVSHADRNENMSSRPKGIRSVASAVGLAICYRSGSPKR